MNFPEELVLQQQAAAATVAVYFTNPTQTYKYYGFEVKSEVFEGTFQEVNKWLNDGRTNPVFGGFKFDEQKTSSSKIMNGYFFEAQTVYELNEQKIYGQPLSTLEPNNKEVKSSKNKIIEQRDETVWPNKITKIVDILNTQTDNEKVVLGRQRLIKLADNLNLAQIIEQLQQQQPNSYHFILKYHDEIFVSATPERLAMVKDGQVATAAVAGSIQRGATQETDLALQTELLNDPKNVQEHAYVVAMIAKKIGQLAEIKPIAKPIILQTPQIQHLYTPIIGSLKAGKTLLDIAQILHPTPALGGTPKAWALDVIKDTETFARGLFASPIGMLLPNGNGELIIGIRSMYVEKNIVRLFAGAGILAQSDPQSEYKETDLKMQPMMNLLENLD